MVYCRLPNRRDRGICGKRVRMQRRFRESQMTAKSGPVEVAVRLVYNDD